MGCSSTIEYEGAKSGNVKLEHFICVKRKYDKHSIVDFKQNTNKFLGKNFEYYKDQDPGIEEFIDERFPHNWESFIGKHNGKPVDKDSSRYSKNLNGIDFSESEVSWKRAKDIWGESLKIFDETISKEDFEIGQVKDYYFVTAFYSLLEYPELILQLFKTVELPADNTAIQVNARIDAEWKIVSIDDYFPITTKNDKVIFCDSPTKNIWLVILEKVWAKINGGYANIVTGTPRDVFLVFVPFENIPINVYRENTVTLWKNILEANEKNCIIHCHVKEDTDVDKVGLINNMSYFVVKAFERNYNLGTEFDVNNINYKLLQIQTCFDKGMFTGDYSEFSDKWDDYSKKTFPEFHGRSYSKKFFIDYESFIKYFEIINICVPIIPLISVSLKIQKDRIRNWNVLKIKLDKESIICITVFRKNFRFHRKIKSDAETISNIIIAKIDKKHKTFIYIASGYNETKQRDLEEGEYIILYNVFHTDDEDQRKYSLNISCTSYFTIAECNNDNDKHLLRFIMFPTIEKEPKWGPILQRDFVLFTGTFMESSLSYVYMKNNTFENKIIECDMSCSNLKSIDGDFPKFIDLPHSFKFLWIYNRSKAYNPYSISAFIDFKREKDIVGKTQYKQEINMDKVNEFLEDSEYEKPEINYIFDQV